MQLFHVFYFPCIFNAFLVLKKYFKYKVFTCKFGYFLLHNIHFFYCMEAESSQIYKENLYLEPWFHCFLFLQVKLVYRAMLTCLLYNIHPLTSQIYKSKLVFRVAVSLHFIQLLAVSLYFQCIYLQCIELESQLKKITFFCNKEASKSILIH